MFPLFLLGLKNLTMSEQRMLLDEGRALWDVDVLTAFSECQNFAAVYSQLFVNKIGYTTIELTAGEAACVVGSIVIGSEDQYHVKSAVLKPSKEGVLPEWEYTEKDNVITVVPNIKVNLKFNPSDYMEMVKQVSNLVTVAAPPVTIIKCDDACKVQIHPVAPSYDLRAKLSAYIPIDISFKYDSYVSTEYSSSFEIKHKRKFSLGSKLSGSLEFTQGLVLTDKPLKYSYSRQEKCDFISLKDSITDDWSGLGFHSSKSGVSTQSAKSNWFIPWFNVKEIALDLFSNPFKLVSLNPLKVLEEKLLNLDCVNNISWTPAASSSGLKTVASQTERDAEPNTVYMDKYTYKMPQKGGAYTKKEMDAENDPWYIKYKLYLIIGGVAIGVIIVVVAVVVIVMQNKKKSKSSSSSSSSNNKV